MINLLVKTHEVLEANNLKGLCWFCNERQGIEIAHIIANTKAHKNLIIKRLGVSKVEAQYLLDMPLLNTIWSCPQCNGRGFNNSKVCKTDDIKFICSDLKELFRESITFIKDNNLFDIDCFKDVEEVSYGDFGQRDNIMYTTKTIQKYQRIYQRLLIGQLA